MIIKLMKKWNTLRKSKKGFTLIEMVAVVGIIAILIAALQPKLEAARNQAKYAANDLNAKLFMNLLEESIPASVQKISLSGGESERTNHLAVSAP